MRVRSSRASQVRGVSDATTVALLLWPLGMKRDSLGLEGWLRRTTCPFTEPFTTRSAVKIW